MPMFKRPAFFCALSSVICAVTYIFTTNRLVFTLLALIFTLFAFLCYKLTFKAITAVIIIVFCVLSCVGSIDTVNEFEKLDNTNIDLQVVALQNKQKTDKVYLVNAKCLNGGFPFKNNKITLLMQRDAYYDINAGDIFNVSVSLTGYKDSNYRLNSYSQGLYASGYINGKIVKVGEDSKLCFYQKVRDYVRKTVFDNLSKDSASTILAITTGDKSYISEYFFKAIKYSGVSHVMVVSGMHLAIIMALVFAILDRLFYNKYLKLLFSVLTVLFVCGVCNFGVSIIRAGIMYIAAALAPIFKRDSDSLSCLGIAVFISVIDLPFIVFNVAFQLSVLATFGIVFLAPFYSELIISKLKVTNTFLCTIISMIIATLSAQIMTMPISTYVFGYTSLIAPVTNILISYAVTFALSINSLALIFAKIDFLFFIPKLLFKITDLITKYINACIIYCASVPFAAMKTDMLFTLLSILIIIILLLLTLCLRLDERRSHKCR